MCGVPRETSKTIRDLVAGLWRQPFREYLGSDDFSRFCGEHELTDEWSRSLVLTHDNAALYGDSVERGAFFLFLSHLYHHRGEEFLSLFSGLVADFSSGYSCTLQVEDLERDLVSLGYSPQEVRQAFAGIPPGMNRPGNQDNCHCT